MAKRNSNKGLGRIKRAARWAAETWGRKHKAIASVLVVASLAVFIAALCYWAWAAYLADEAMALPQSETLRNLALFLGVPIGIILAVWRSWVAERQVRESQRQATILRQQAGTAERSLLHDRYQKGADMLGSKTFAVRIGGVYTLERLAAEHADEYHIQVMDLLCAFVRISSKKFTKKKPREGTVDSGDFPRCPPDVEAAAMAIGTRSECQMSLERKNDEWRLNLEDAYLAHVEINNRANFSNANLNGANFSGADLYAANFSGARLIRANFADARLYDANFSGAHLWGADLSGADLSNARLAGADLSDADLSNARLSGSDVSGDNL